MEPVTPRESLWEAVQKKTFCGWVNMHLQQRELRVQNLETDLSDGVILINLLEILNGEPIEGRYYRNPKSKPYKIDNVTFALNFITDVLGVKLISCSAEDIVEGNLKIILGMLWRLILKFQLKNENNSRNTLFAWCNNLLSSYPNIRAENFHTSFVNGLIFCALLHKFNPELLDYYSLNPEDKIQNLRLAFNVAEEVLDIPQLLDPEDISKGLADERSVMTYLSMLQKVISSKSPEETKSTLPPLILPTVNAEKLDDKCKSLVSENDQLVKEISGLNEQLEQLKQQLQKAQEKNQELRVAQDLHDFRKSNSEILHSLENQSEDFGPELSGDEYSDSEVSADESEGAPTPEAPEPSQDASEQEKEVKFELPKPVDIPSEVPVSEPEHEPKPVEAPREVALRENVDKASFDKRKTRSVEDPNLFSQSIADIQAENSRLNAMIEESHLKFRQQIRVSETLQKSLEDIREEILIAQKKQKKAHDRALKRIQKKYERRISRREHEIQSIQRDHTCEMQQKCNEITTLRRQLKKIQEALGGGAVGPSSDEPVLIDLDIQALKVEKDDIMLTVKLFEEEQIAYMARIKRSEDENDDAYQD